MEIREMKPCEYTTHQRNVKGKVQTEKNRKKVYHMFSLE
jgi:hypothetical protein